MLILEQNVQLAYTRMTQPILKPESLTEEMDSKQGQRSEMMGTQIQLLMDDMLTVLW